MLTLTNEQREAVDRMASEETKAALNASELGTGKTVMSVELVRALGAQTVLVIGPIGVSHSWRGTFESQGCELPMRVINSTKKGIANFTLLQNKDPGIYFVGREFLYVSGTDSAPRKTKNAVLSFDSAGLDAGSYSFAISHDGKTPVDYTVNTSGGDERFSVELKDFPNFEKHEVIAPTEIGNRVCLLPNVYSKGRAARWSWSKVHPDLLVYDEVHAIQNRKSRGFDVLKTIPAGYRLGLSATPQGNKFSGLWAVCRWLWPKAISKVTNALHVDKSFWRWAAKWAVVVDDCHAGKRVEEERVPGAFVATLPCYVRLEAKRDEVNKETISVDLSPAQRKAYDEMEKDALTYLEEHPLEEDVPVVVRQRLRQITLGVPTIEDGVVTFAPGCKSTKLEALEELIAEMPDEPMLILTDSKKFAKVAAERLGPMAREWTGDVSAGTRNKIKEQFGSEVKYIVAQIRSIAEGIDGLQRVCRVVVWLSELEGQVAINDQALGRINRTGQERPVLEYKILARNTHDDGIFKSLVQRAISNRASVTINQEEN